MTSKLVLEERWSVDVVSCVTDVLFVEVGSSLQKPQVGPPGVHQVDDGSRQAIWYVRLHGNHSPCKMVYLHTSVKLFLVFPRTGVDSLWLNAMCI